MEPTTRRATNRFRNAGITARAKATVGSFFDELPAGRDTYLLAHVLHDWPDADATRILQRVAEAAPRQVVVVERITSGDTPTFRDGWSDLRMRLLFGSGERTLHDWTQLTVAAGFTITEIHPWDDSGGAAIVLRT